MQWQNRNPKAGKRRKFRGGVAMQPQPSWLTVAQSSSGDASGFKKAPVVTHKTSTGLWGARNKGW